MEDAHAIVLDLDHFKAVNDSHGHDAGDRVLQELAVRIRSTIRNVDMACRVGGEEFVVVLPATDAAVAEKIAERMRKSVGSKAFAAGTAEPLNITLSIGVATLVGIEDKVEDIMKRADLALYQAKNEGRNRVISAAA